MELSNTAKMPPVFGAPSSNTNTGPISHTKTPTPPPAANPAKSSLIKTIIIVFLGLLLVGAGVLAFSFYSKYQEASSDLETKIKVAVVEAENNQAKQDQLECAESKKDPRREFKGPEDYGSIYFKYPQTWSSYIAKDAANGGDFEAYFGVNEVNLSNKSALHITIKTTSIEKASQEYSRDLKEGLLEATTTEINGETATRYNATTSNSKFLGSIVIFSIRGQVITFQTDNRILYGQDFDQILSTINYNK